jgi:tetratricopeptide (TPR) repeat protein
MASGRGDTAPHRPAPDAPYCERYVLLALLALVAMACQLSSPRRHATHRRSPLALRWRPALAALAACSVHYAAVYTSNLTFCEQWARSSPGYYLAHYNLGRAQEDTGLDSAAQASYQRSLELNAGWASSHANLGALLLRTGRPEEALRAFERWRELDPDSARAHYGVGVAQLQLGNARAAIGPLVRAVKLESGSAEVHHNLGVACARNGELERARHHLEEALRIDPAKANSRQSLELVLEQLGRE